MDDGEAESGKVRPGSEHMATWIELFYDLAFVAALLIYSSAGSGMGDLSRTLWNVLVFGVSWWVWFTTTVHANRFPISDLPHRLLLLTQMVVIVLVAMEAHASVKGHSAVLAQSSACCWPPWPSCTSGAPGFIRAIASTPGAWSG